MTNEQSIRLEAIRLACDVLSKSRRPFDREDDTYPFMVAHAISSYITEGAAYEEVKDEEPTT
jgi:hypothetical protein